MEENREDISEERATGDEASEPQIEAQAAEAAGQQAAPRHRRQEKVGLVTSESDLAEATGLPFALTAPPVSHGGLRVTLYRTGPLP